MQGRCDRVHLAQPVLRHIYARQVERQELIAELEELGQVGLDAYELLGVSVVPQVHTPLVIQSVSFPAVRTPS
jgi:hypothetical protein